MRQLKKEENLTSSGFGPSGGSQSENERKWKDNFLLQNLKTVEQEGSDNANRSWCTLNGPQRLKKNPGKLEIWRRIETIQKITFLRLARIQNRPETWGGLTIA